MEQAKRVKFNKEQTATAKETIIIRKINTREL